MQGNGISSILTNAELRHAIYIGAGGAMLVLLQSILSGERRVWWRLLLSCVVGGSAAALAGHIFHDSKWVYAICGVAAIMAENVIFGLVKASAEFKENPITVFSHFVRMLLPTFGKTADKASDAFGEGTEKKTTKDTGAAVG